jgi:hypothetical protein
MKLEERFNADYLYTIIENFDDLKENGIIPISWDKKWFTDYLSKSRHGFVKTEYYQKDNRGRMHPKKSLSLAKIPRIIRHTISKDIYNDYDIKCCAQVLLYNLCKNKYHIECDELEFYVKNREDLISENRENGKKIYNILTYRDESCKDLTNLTDHQRKYQIEMKRIHKQICKYEDEKYNDFVDKLPDDKKSNTSAKYVCSEILDLENDILMDFYKCLGSPKDCVLCFDGIMYDKNKKINLQKINKFISEKYNFKYFEILKKDMNEGIDLSEEFIYKYKYPRLQYFSDIDNLINNDIYVEHIEEWIQNSIRYLNDSGSTYTIVKNKKNGEDNWEFCPFNKFEKSMNSSYNCKVINMDYNKDKNIPYLLYDSMGFKKKGALGDFTKNNKIKTYYGVDFRPYLLRDKNPLEKKKIFNYFSGYKYDSVDIYNYDTEKFINSAWNSHILNEFCNGNKDEYNNLMDTLTDILIDPMNLSGIAHLFFSGQGTGKTLFSRFLTEIYGEKNVVTIDDPSGYFQCRFNSDSCNKVIKLFEEMQEKGTGHQFHNRLKAEITCKNERVEKKGIDAQYVTNCARYMFFTNNPNSLYIEADDRRYVMHKISNKYKNNRKYFSPIYEEFKDKDFFKSAFAYLVQRQYSKENLDAYMTDYKIDQKIQNLNNGLSFIIDYVTEYDENIDEFKNENHNILVKDLKDAYNIYCTDNGIRYHYNTLTTQLKIINLCSKRKKIKNKLETVFIINPISIRDELRNYLSIPDWDYPKPDK